VPDMPFRCVHKLHKNATKAGFMNFTVYPDKYARDKAVNQ